MREHRGNMHHVVERILQFYLGNYYDEFLRVELVPRARSDRKSYSHENPWLFSATFCALLQDVNIADSLVYKQYWQDHIFRIKQSKAGPGLWSRQPFGNNTYPKNHPEYNPDRNWNTISKDEYVGIVYFANDKLRMQISVRADIGLPMDDYNGLDSRFNHPLSSRYYYLKAVGEKPSLSMKAHWYLDKVYDIIMTKYFRWSPWKKKIADTVIKDFVRAQAGVGDKPCKDLMIWAIDTYYPSYHPFKELVRLL